MKYKWQVKEPVQIDKDFLDIAFGSKIIAQLLLNRGINSKDKAKYYLNSNLYKESKSEEIPDLIKAKNRIIEAINKKEKITIFGDYDVDGVTSTSCLLLALRQFTDKIDFYIPNRLTEGYGLNIEAVKIIAKKNKKSCNGKPLLITCDCGITNHKEIDLANELGIDVIVTDHHSLPEILPPACAVLNPKLLPSDHKLHFLPGVGVAYKLAEAVLEELGRETLAPTKNDLLDLVALGMIADLAPLVDENRYLVQIGLKQLMNTKKIGLEELLKMCGISTTVDAEHIGFGIAPRINAVGRLADANRAVKLLTTNDLLEAIQIACELEAQNRERQVLCEETLNEAIEMIKNQRSKLNTDRCIVLAKEGWHHGVIGIVASRIVEKFSKPTVLIAIDKEQNIARGSGRSIEQLNIVDALTKSSKHLEKFGGHKAACGLSVKPELVNNFILDFTNCVNEILLDIDLTPVLNIDLELPFSSLNIDLINQINKLAPFGLGNKMPIFVSDEVEIIGIRNIGKNGQHLKLILQTENVIARNAVTKQSPNASLNEIASPSARNDTVLFEALIWNHDNNIQLNLGDKTKIAYTPKLNHFNGKISIQLEVKDWELLSGSQEEIVVELFDYRERAFVLQNTSAMYFAEVSQKNHLPLKTHSRNKITKAENLIFLECPPDEMIFIDVIKKCQASKVYLAFSLDIQDKTNPVSTIQRLIGMLKYVKNNKDSKVTEIELQSALGINKSTLAYALETLVKIGFLSYKKDINGLLDVDISNPARQNFNELIEYNLLLSELKKITGFREKFSKASSDEVVEMLSRNNIEAKVVFASEVRMSL